MLPVIWCTGLSGAGKSTLCRAVERELWRHIPAFVLDADILWQSLSKDLGYLPEDRAENLRRISKRAKQPRRALAIRSVLAFTCWIGRGDLRRRIYKTNDSSAFRSQGILPTIADQYWLRNAMHGRFERNLGM